MADPLRFLYADLIGSPIAGERYLGIERWQQHHGDVVELLALLDDDAPVVLPSLVAPERDVVTEVRIAALIALQHRYRMARKEWDLGPVTLRSPLPAEFVLHRATDLLVDVPETSRHLLLSGVDRQLDEVVRPAPVYDALCRGYLLLQTLGEIAYLRQSPEAANLLTPLQLEWQEVSMMGAPPRPYLLFPLATSHGYMYADHQPGSWIIDLDDGQQGLAVRNYLTLVMQGERGGVPRVRFDDDGRPRTTPDGRLAVGGLLPHNTTDHATYLRSVAAFVQRRFPVQLMT